MRAHLLLGRPNRALRVLRERSEAVSARVRSAVAAELAGRNLAAAARAGFDAADAEAERVLRQPGARAPACGRGCAFCCHVHVDATPAEIEAIAEYVVSTRSPAELEALALALPRATGLTHDERWAARLPCALLAADHSCSIHPVRPLRCRAFHSCDADVCREAFGGGTEPDPVENETLARVYDAAESGSDAALADRGIPTSGELLEAALLRRLFR
jgi:Fe-S-cluster containining protein